MLLRSTTAERAPALWALACGVVAATTLAVYFAADRLPDDAARRHGRTLAFAVPIVGAGAVAATWSHAYGFSGASSTLRLAAVAGCVGLAGAAAVGARRLAHRSPLPFLAVLVVAVLGAAFASTRLAADAVGGSAGGGSVAAGMPRAVVLITIDTLRPDFIGAGSDAAAPTPALDALAADSVVFDNARSAAPWTKPALATILTGLSPLVHRTTSRRVRLPNEVETLAETLADAGYVTAGMGLNTHLEPIFNFGQGFRDYAFPARADWGVGIGARLLRLWRPHVYPELFPSTEAIADVACAWVEGHHDAPFFLWMHVLDPHWPYAPPPEWVDAERPNPRLGYFWGDPDTVTAVQAGNTKLGEEDREWVRELYRAEIRYADDNVARLLDTLRRLELYDDALIVLASDHGEEFWEHGRFEHGHTMYDEVLRVPLAFKLPGAVARDRIDAAVSTESLTPTLLDAAGVEFDPARFSAPSLVPWWSGTGEARSEPLFATGTYYHGEKQAVVFDGKKLVVELDTGRVELYDLAADPEELRSLSAASEEDLREGVRLLDAWMERSAALRETLGLKDDDTFELSADVQARLQALGYGGEDGGH